MSEIKPALTAEKWEAAFMGKHVVPDGKGIPVDGSVEDEWWGYPHEIAALCLYGQSFGFTHEQIATLRDLHAKLEDFQTGWLYNHGQPSLDTLRDVLDRIEALLPPRISGGR